MASIEKLIHKMQNQPNGIRWSEAEKVLEAFGYKFNRQNGSHRHYINANGDVITIVQKDPLRAAYVKDILKRISLQK